MDTKPLPLVILEGKVFIGIKLERGWLVEGEDYLTLDYANLFQCERCAQWWPMDVRVEGKHGANVCRYCRYAVPDTDCGIEGAVRYVCWGCGKEEYPDRTTWITNNTPWCESCWELNNQKPTRIITPLQKGE
jgi:hypothetical protein